MQRHQVLTVIIAINSVLPKEYNNTTQHHLCFLWLWLTHPLWCEIITTYTKYQEALSWNEHITPVKEELMGWEHLLRCRPTNKWYKATFPTFTKWGNVIKNAISI